MKIKLFTITLLFFLSTPTWSQTSLEAKDLLEKASKKLDKYVSFEIEFIYVLNNRIEQINQESKGKVIIAGDKYKLIFLMQSSFLMVKIFIQLYQKMRKLP